MAMHIDSTCRNAIKFVCKTDMNDKAPPQNDDRGELLPCGDTLGDGWHESSTEKDHGHSCFRVFADRKVGWYEAEHHCNGWGGHLASIHSQSFDDLIHSVAMNEANTLKYWIGTLI